MSWSNHSYSSPGGANEPSPGAEALGNGRNKNASPVGGDTELLRHGWFAHKVCGKQARNCGELAFPITRDYGDHAITAIYLLFLRVSVPPW
jgi:hypothetical protein